MGTDLDSTVENTANTAYLTESETSGVRAAVIMIPPTYTPRARDTYSTVNDSTLWLTVPSTMN